MFGFIRLNAQNIKSTPIGASQEIVVTRENIYRPTPAGSEPLLLLRKGFELPMEALPRLLQSGAKISQFKYKNSEEPINLSQVSHLEINLPPVAHNYGASGTSNPISGRKMPRRSQTKRTVILEPDAKDLKRAVDCLFNCGFELDHIHPTRLTKGVAWTIDKYRPQVLMINHRLPGLIDGFTMLQQFSQLSYVEHLILTVTEEEYPAIQAESEAWQTEIGKSIHIITKPLNRFSLHRLISTKKAKIQEVSPEPL